jgi:SPP1 family predicted phage head-tail adaptor
MSLRGHIDPRQFDQRVTFDRLYQTRSATGAMVPDWVPLVTCWAKVDGAKATSAEPRIADQTLTVRDYIVWVRAEVHTQFTLSPLDRVRWKAHTFNISDIPDQGLRGRVIGVVCRAGKNEG